VDVINNNNDISECRYTWNDFVLIKGDAPVQFHPGEIGVICGMSKIQFVEVAKKYHSEVGRWIYTVEFGNGSDIQVSEAYLEKYNEQNK
jgi:hypothetical protein